MLKHRSLLLGSMIMLLSMTLGANSLLAAHRSLVRVNVRLGHGHRHHNNHYYHYGSHYSLTRRYRPVVRVTRINYGEVDFNVRPQRSKIYVDGHYLGIADDFNGYPQTAKLSPGYHFVKVVAPDGSVERRRIYVAVGRELNFNLKF